ncbi:MAG: molybdenum cofactor guanylyltransferase [Spirochaetota bacterium]|nr:molybdenum cofactor guanylyltransferase [Spirochaetota bacterium]
MLEKVPVYILSGGKSSRFGEDKAKVIYNNNPLIVHIAHSVETIAKKITVVADKADKYDYLGLRTIEDEIKDLGPISGLHRAISDMEEEGWLFLTSCDLLGIRDEWLNMLISAPRGEYQIVAFRGEFWETLFTLYHISVFNAVNDVISKGKYALWRIFNYVDCLALSYPDNWNESMNINRPTDLRKFGSLKKV